LSNRDNKRSSLANNSYLLIAAAWAITISFIIDNYWSGTSTPQVVQKNIQRDIKKKQRDFEALCADTNLVFKLASNQYTETSLQQFEPKKYFVFIYKTGGYDTDSCLFWSTQVVQPDSSVIESANNNYTAKLLNGWYVVNKKIIKAGNNKYKIISLIPVKWDYYIVNKYLINSFAAVDKIENDYDVSLSPGGLAITGIGDNILFYLLFLISVDLYVFNRIVTQI